MIFHEEYDYFKDRAGLSGLFQLLQDVAGSHCGHMGLSAARLAQDGLMWVVVRHYAKISRLPLPGEHIAADTWHGGTKHRLFPRYYRVFSADGTELIEGGAVWAMVDMQTRRMADPADYSIALQNEEIGGEPRTPDITKKLPQSDSAEFIVPQKYIDLNGHMNNTRYYDAAESCIASETSGLSPAAVTTTFISEVRQGEDMIIRWGSRNGVWYITGETDKPIFRMSIEYK